MARPGGDVHVALPPLDLASAENLIARTRVSRILSAYRDVPAADRHAIAAVLVALGNIASVLPQIRAMDLNPVLADANGVVVVDARVVLEPDPACRRRPAIRPYPGSWTSQLTLGERSFLIRPMKPEDELAIGAMLGRVTLEDLRLRFFAPLKSFSHAFLARLTQLDYAREMAFIAIEEGSREAAGAVRLHGRNDRRRIARGRRGRSPCSLSGAAIPLTPRSPVPSCRARRIRPLCLERGHGLRAPGLVLRTDRK